MTDSHLFHDSVDVDAFEEIKALADDKDPTLCWKAVQEFFLQAHLLAFRLEARLRNNEPFHVSLLSSRYRILITILGFAKLQNIANELTDRADVSNNPRKYMFQALQNLRVEIQRLEQYLVVKYFQKEAQPARMPWIEMQSISKSPAP